ncbi:lysine exporter LysO family protein [Clostridium grantii]|uniref:Lysine exporter LysO family protein n=1 Tax=Clostridium grantii DSM 8605 TaxID=1121316 RepID=A0A1M5XCT6_9CLOT|nr:lysine exporter LysO family protein [Clostridium grantii]SHH97655.1 Membrane protein of unknown function [Clostridium grantii DSM 8605]
MTYIIIISIISGAITGYFFLPESIALHLDAISSISLYVLIFLVGIDVASNKSLIKDLKKLGFKIVLIPMSIIFGSLIGGYFTSLILKLPINTGLAIASGFGWYSLSGVLLTNLCNAEVGTIAFLTNVFRELIAVITIPILATKLNFFTAIAPAGATSMDTTLPLISNSTNSEIAVISFINGAILSTLVPILVTFFFTI